MATDNTALPVAEANEPVQLTEKETDLLANKAFCADAIGRYLFHVREKSPGEPSYLTVGELRRKWALNPARQREAEMLVDTVIGAALEASLRALKNLRDGIDYAMGDSRQTEKDTREELTQRRPDYRAGIRAAHRQPVRRSA